MDKLVSASWASDCEGVITSKIVWNTSWGGAQAVG